MTSHERTGTSTYNGTNAPVYDILSYTWGRFTAAEGSPALAVKNTTWKIPAVQQNCFSVGAFQNVINYMGQEVEWLWVDVACIDQENYEAKMAEVRRQFGIFQNARRAYVWLHALDNSQAQQFLDDIDNFYNICATLSSQATEQEILPSLWSPLFSLAATLDGFFRDPWFTSLWTLQESILRRDAIILCSNASPLQRGEPSPYLNTDWTLERLTRRCERIDEILRFHLRRKSIPDELIKTTREVLTLLEKSGMHRHACRNPNFWFGVARHRETSFPLDRVFGILALFDLTEEESAQLVGGASDLQGLQGRLALFINHRSPILGQCFVHLETPAPGRSWCVGQSTTVPSEYTISRLEGERVLNPCSLSLVEKGNIKMATKAVPLGVLLVYWQHMLRRGSSFYGSRVLFDLGVYFDHIVHEICPPDGVERPEPFVEVSNRQERFFLTEELVKTVATNKIMVLLLGQKDKGLKGHHENPQEHETDDHFPDYPHIIQKRDGNILQKNEERVENVDGIEWALRWERIEVQRKSAGGLIVMKDKDEWKRIGFCYWNDDSSTPHEFVDWEGEIF